ncbi:MAG: VWA domain-containing protein [Brevefilum sp.]|nr:VWA domain-containing protein [Brevefilum sp.]
MAYRKYLVFLLSFVYLLTASVGVVSANSATDLLIHQIDSQVNEDGETYTISMTVSAISERNNPLTGLTIRDFIVQEDGAVVEIDSVELLDDEPMRVFVVMDNGATMQGERFRLAMTAISNFIKDLFRGDQVGIFAFNNEFKEVVALTNDLNKAREDFENARLSPSGGACLFDAIYATMEYAHAQPETQRQAIVVLSSREDTITGYNTCSKSSVDDILALSRSVDQHLPVYTIGVGVDTDEISLKRISEATNGLYSSSTSNYDLEDLFKAASNRFISEYEITYTSTNIPGEHTLSIQLDNQSKTSSTEFPGLPPVVTIASPGSADEFEAGPTKLVLSLVERGVFVDSLTFKINDVAIGVGGKITQPPFEYEIDFSQYEGQLVLLTIITQDRDGKPLSETNLELNFGAEIPPVADEEEGAAAVAKTPSSPTQADELDCPEEMVCLGELQLSMRQLIIVGSVLFAVVIIIIIVVIFSKKKKGKGQPKKDKVSLFDDATIDGFTLPNAQMGRLTILSSDDPLMVGKEFQLMKSPSTIGRSVNNDIPLPKDSAVSRKHVEIVADSDGVILQEIYKTLSDGTKQSPTYGTYVNDRKVTSKTTLHTGDEISLGRRTKLRYEGPALPGGSDDSDDVTVDQIQLPDLEQFDDSTRDG